MKDAIRARFHWERPNFTFDFDGNIHTAGLTAIFGPSGSGKTTLLRLIAGLDKSQNSYLKVNNELWQQGDFFLPSHKRSAAFVFQSSGLLPHLNVIAHLDFVKTRARKSSRELNFDSVVSVCGIDDLLNRSVDKLSGGERQRVAIACALLSNPKLLLLDEPISALDQKAKNIFLPFLESLKTELEIPMLYVTHSIAEVARLADNIVHLESGRVKSSGLVNSLIGDIVEFGDDGDLSAVVSARVVEKQTKWHLARLHFGEGDIWLRDESYVLGQELRISVLAKDVSISLSHHRDTSILNCLPAVVESLHELTQGFVRVDLRIGSTRIISRITARSAANLKLKVGQEVFAQIKSAALLN